MSRRIPCHFHQRPGGCRNGDRCTFPHVGSSGGTFSIAGNNAASNSNSPTGPRDTPGLARAPPGICNDFWRTGQCRRGFGCRYRHEQQAGIALAIKSSLPVMTAGGLTASTLSATQVHNHIRTFLADQYRFRTANDIYAFVRLLGNATEENNWVRQHALDFMRSKGRTHEF
jgi:hypothetical protein